MIVNGRNVKKTFVNFGCWPGPDPKGAPPPPPSTDPKMVVCVNGLSGRRMRRRFLYSKYPDPLRPRPHFGRETATTHRWT